jgi:hypothetical protein
VLASAATLVVLFLLAAGPASAATVPLNGRTFDAACSAAAAGDTVTVPAGSYGSQTLSCQKAVTFQLDGGATLSVLNFNGANGPTVAGGRIVGDGGSGAVSFMHASNVTLRGATINNTIYVEGSANVGVLGNVIEPGPGGTTWANGDMIDIYEQSRSSSNRSITIADNVIHGLRAPSSSAHPDAIQLCNCGNPDQIPQDIKILRNRFYDNECMNIRANERDDMLVEQNLFGDTVKGITGCGDFALDVYYANATVRYNTFTGKQKIQVDTNAKVGQSQTWIGNVGAGMSSSCGAISATYSHNVWTGQKCGATDKQVSSLKLNGDGSPQAGSPVIDAGDTGVYPPQDVNGGNRYVGGAPDAGAYEFGATVGGPANGPTTTTAPATVTPTAPKSKPAGTSDADLVATGAGPAGLVAAFGFDEQSGNVIRDVSGNGLNGLRRGAARVKAGKFGRALWFDGINDRVTVKDSARLRLKAGMTLEAWVRPTAVRHSRLVLSRGGGRHGLAYALYASDRRAPAGSVRIRAKASTVQRARAKARLPVKQWSHVAVTFDGKMVRIYVNGEWITSEKATGSLSAVGGALRIGGGASRATSFRGFIDEVRVYDRALPGAEIQADLTRPVS